MNMKNLIYAKKNILFLNIIIIFTVIFISCSSDKYFILDNPTKKDLTVHIDGISYKLDPFSFQKLLLKAGKHTLKLSSGEELNFIIYYNNNGGVINPSLSTYYLWSIVFASDENKEKETTESDCLMIDGIEYSGPFIEIKDLIIDNNEYSWKYEIHQPVPEAEYANDSGNLKNISAKLFTKQEFINFFEMITDTIGFHEKNKTETFVKTPKYVKKERSYTIPNSDNPEIKKYLTEIIELDKSYLSAEKASTQKAITKKFMSTRKKLSSLLKNENKISDEISKFKLNNIGKGVNIPD